MSNEVENLEDRAARVADRTYLTHREAELYILRYEEGMTHAAASHKMGISEGNARGKWANIKKKVNDAPGLIEKARNTEELL